MPSSSRLIPDFLSHLVQSPSLDLQAPVVPKSRSSRNRLPEFPPLHHRAYSDLLTPHLRPDPFLPPLSSHLVGSTRATLACFPVLSPRLDPTPFINFTRIEQLIVGQICTYVPVCRDIVSFFLLCLPGSGHWLSIGDGLSFFSPASHPHQNPLGLMTKRNNQNALLVFSLGACS